MKKLFSPEVSSTVSNKNKNIQIFRKYLSFNKGQIYAETIIFVCFFLSKKKVSLFLTEM